MVEQTKDSMFTEYGVSHNAEPANKSPPLKDENSMTVGSSNVPSGEVIEISVTENPVAEGSVNPTPTTNNTAIGPKVYSRRRPEDRKPKKKNVSETQNDAPVDSQKSSTDQSQSQSQSETTQEHAAAERSEPVISISDVSAKISSPENSSPNDPTAVGNKLREERHHLLQRVLKLLDQPENDEHYIQMLWSMNSAQLSRQALELEKRSIMLSCEEAKELNRASFLDVLGKNPKDGSTRAQSSQQQLHK